MTLQSKVSKSAQESIPNLMKLAARALAGESEGCCEVCCRR